VTLRLGTGRLPCAADALGADHPVSRAAEVRRVIVRQLATASVVLAAAALGVDRDGAHELGTFLGAAAAVEVCLAIAAFAAAVCVHERARDVIADGGDLAVAEVEPECRRLADPRHRAALAVALGRALAAADRQGVPLTTRPPPSACNLLPYRATIVDVIDLVLASESTSVRGVALLDRLVRGGYAAPLYVGRPGDVGRELARIRMLLASDGPRAGSAR
jgi:hypothetical protein